MKEIKRFCVIGAGNGGLAMAGHLAIMGKDVNLWNRSEERLAPIKKRNGIEVTGEINGFGRIKSITTDIEEALSETDAILVVIPATGHSYVARIAAPYLKSDQIVILNPGKTGGSLEFANILKQFGVVNDVLVSETQTFLYASRALDKNRVVIKGIKKSVPLASIPSYTTPYILDAMNSVFPQFTAADSILSTSLDNMGAIFHPAIMLFNISRIEQKHKFDYYSEGATPSISYVLEAMDRERISVARALGIHTHTARDWLYIAYDAAGKDLYRALLANQVYKGIASPTTIDHRYITEDVPMSLVPIASIGDMLGVPTPTIKAIIQIASIMHDTDYMKMGRTTEKLGIQGMSVKEIRRFAMEGIMPAKLSIIAKCADSYTSPEVDKISA